MQTQSYDSLGHSRYQDLLYPQPTSQIKARLNEMISTLTHLREDVAGVKDPQARALFETTREVLKDLVAAYDLYERRTDQAA